MTDQVSCNMNRGHLLIPKLEALLDDLQSEDSELDFE